MTNVRNCEGAKPWRQVFRVVVWREQLVSQIEGVRFEFGQQEY